MKLSVVAGMLLCFGTFANAANLSIDLTGATPTFTTDGNWDSVGAGTFTETSFTGNYGANDATNGSNTVDIVDTNTGDVLYALAITYSANGNEETFNVGTTQENDTTAPTAGAIVEDATGSSVDFTADFPTGFPSNITIQETADSPAVPEPATSALLGLGLVALALTGRRFARKSA